jgi:uncharacterized protein YdcH (DUF465 family)
VRFLQVTVGGRLGIGDKHFQVLIEVVERVSEGFVTVEQNREKVQEAPELDLRHETCKYYGYPSPA